jgi:cell division septation protein DedD
MSQAPAADQEVVVGQVQGVVQKSGPPEPKWQIEVNIGQQNPRRLWTKDGDLVQQMMMMIGQQVSFMCGVSHWTNSQNQPVRSLWINGYGQPGSMPTQPVQQQPVQQQPMQQPVQQQWQQPVPQQQPAQQWPTQQPGQQQPSQRDVTEDKIHRQTATKVAVHLLKHLTPDQQTFDNLIKISERLVSYYDNGVTWAPQQQQPVGGADPGPQGIPHSDDEIPF